MRVFIIRQSEIQLSKSFSLQAESSAIRQKLDPDFFEGLTGDDAIDLLMENKIGKSKDPSIEWNKGTIGCLGSHLSLWLKCITDNTPLLIMEHDAVLLKDPTELVKDVEDICHLDSLIPFNSSYGEQSSRYREEYEQAIINNRELKGVCDYPDYHFYGDRTVTGKCFVGAYGYLVTPQGANKLINFMRHFGAYPADKVICERALKLQRSNASYIKLNPFFDTLEKQRAFTTRK